MQVKEATLILLLTIALPFFVLILVQVLKAIGITSNAAAPSVVGILAAFAGLGVFAAFPEADIENVVNTILAALSSGTIYSMLTSKKPGAG